MTNAAVLTLVQANDIVNGDLVLTKNLEVGTVTSCPVLDFSGELRVIIQYVIKANGLNGYISAAPGELTSVFRELE